MSTNHDGFIGIHTGNSKLGKKISIADRAVIDSCPSSCTHYHNNCYAEGIELRYKKTREIGLNNLRVQNWQRIRSFILEASRRKNSIRWHSRGDFLKTDSIGRKILDVVYIKNIVRANESIPAEQRPRQWLYTHVHDARILVLEKVGIKVYASIDNNNQLAKAKAAGFKLFAFSSEVRKGKNEKSFEEINSQKLPYCFEQTGAKPTCESCNYCIEGKGDLVFLKH